MKKIILIGGLLIYGMSTFSQESNVNLVFQYFGINENQNEINYIAYLLESNHIPEADRNRAITIAHEYYIAHKEEIETEVKANELIMFRDAVKKAKAAEWAQALTAMATSIATSLPAAIEAGNQQLIENEKKNNRYNDIQAYITQHSYNTPKQYTQNFGNAQVETNVMSRPKVTTSNGYDEPLPSISSTKSVSAPSRETVGLMISNGVKQNVRLKVNGNTIVGRYIGGTVRSPLGDGWTQENLQGTPTNFQLDGELSKMYSYRATSRDINNAVIYF